MKTNLTYLLLGSNLGESKDILKEARALISQGMGPIEEFSSIYKSKAWGNENQNDFLNQVLLVRTELTPYDLLATCLKIENELGRTRFEKWGARTIDIDILYYNDDMMKSKSLTIPHPYIQERRFTLVPLTEISPNFIHPILKKTQAELLLKCPDKLGVEILME